MTSREKLLCQGLPLWLAETNCWIVAPDGPGGECIIIDAPPDPDRILTAISQYDLKLSAIVLTHGHVDHIGGIPGVLDHGHQHFQADGSVAHTHDDLPVHIHEADEYRLEDPISTSKLFGPALERSGISYRPPELVHKLNHNDVVRGGGLALRAIHTPGHTEGSTCFLLELDDAPPMLFSGDHLFHEGIGRTDLPGGSETLLMESMAERILTLKDDVVVLPGHGPTTTIGHERANNPYIAHLR